MCGNSSRSHTKPALGAEAINYLGEEGQGKWSIAGWGEKRCIPTLALKLKPLCRKVNTGDGRREVERGRGDSVRGKTREM